MRVLEVSEPATAERPETRTGRPRMFQDIDAFEQAIDAYFTDRDTHQKPYTMHGLARALDCSRQTLITYEQYHDAGAFADAIKRARERVAEWTEDRLHTKGFHPAGAIFSLKNNFGWQDTQTVSVNVGVALGVQVSDEQHRSQLASVDAQILGIANGNPALGTGTPNASTFASDASLSPVPRND
jgi:hypothetical protein